MEPLDCNAIEGSVVQHHHSISIQSQALQGQQGIVGLNHHVTRLVLVWEDAARRPVCLREVYSRVCWSSWTEQATGLVLGLLHKWCVGDREDKDLSPWPTKSSTG